MRYILLFFMVTFVSTVNAKINRVYHPYVVELEREVEYRILYQDINHPNDIQTIQYLGYGQAVSEGLFLEFYIVTEQVDNESDEIAAYEAEARFQLTEQGEYWADWGLLFELEKSADRSKWELKTGVLIEKEWGKWSTTANLLTLYEFGSDYDEEWHTEAALQWRYRYSQHLEPSLEIYSSEAGASIGPALSGQIKMNAKKLNWELGLQFGIDNDAPDNYWRALIEFEF